MGAILLKWRVLASARPEPRLQLEAMSPGFEHPSFSSSSHESRHDGKHAERDEVHGSRHRVPACEVLSNRQTPKPKHDCKFRGEQQGKCDQTDGNSLCPYG